MASNIGIEPALLEMARAMPVESIPEKLRCATCDKLAIGAVKIPCCDSTICTYCHADLSDTECPICTHSPFTASLCLPAKGLQATVKAFIKTEARKRAAEAAAGTKAAAKAPEAEAAEDEKVVPSIEPEQTTTAIEQPDADSEPAPVTREPVPEVRATEENKDGDHQSQGESHDVEQEPDGEEDDEEEEDIVITTERPDDEQHTSNGNGAQVYNDAMQSQNAQFQGQGQTNGQMPFQDNFNGMMGMNGMDPSQMNFMPNMMGMPGMNFGMGMGMGSGNMDPSMMFGNFGGMGMNDMQSMMNMMGMNGMGDMNNFGGMGGPGFFPQGNYMQSNFNGNNQHQPPFFNNDFNQGRGRPYGRGFGRGRGQYARGRGRGGGFGYGYEPQFGQQGQPYNQGGYDQGGPQQQQQQQFDAHDEQTDVPLRRASPTYEAVPGGKESSVAEAHHGEASNDGAHPTERAGTDQEGEKTNDAGDVAIEHDDARTHEHQASGGHGPTSDMAGQDFSDNGNGPAHMHAYGDYAPHEEQHQDYNMQYHDQNGHNGMGRGNFRGGYGRGRGGFNNFYARGQDNTELTPKPAPPLNAPTGPKALREGRPNTGWSGLRAAGQSAQRPVSRAAGNAIDQEHVESIHKETDRESEVQIARTNRSLNGETDRARSKSRSRSRARNGRNRDRSQSVEGESDGSYSRRKDRDRERRRRKERSRRYEDDEYPRSKDEDEPRRKHRSRSESPVEDGSHRRRRDKVDDHRSSRSQRDRSKDKHKRRHRSRSPDRDDADKHDDYSSRRKSKSHRDEDQYEGRDKESRSSRKHSRRDDEEYGDDKHGHSHRSSRNDDRDRDSKRTGRHRESESLRAVIEPPSDELGFKIKGSKSAKSGSHKDREARSSHQEPTSNAASSDPYAEERARAQQNRVAAEAQRRQSSSLGKRGRGDEVIDAPTGPRGMTNSSSSRSKKVRKETRQINYKYEDEIGEDERDAGRWR